QDLDRRPGAGRATGPDALPAADPRAVGTCWQWIAMQYGQLLDGDDPSRVAAAETTRNGAGLSARPCSKRVLRGAGVTVQVLADPVSTPVQFECLLADFRDSLRAEPDCFGKCQDLVFWPPNETRSNVAYA